jgi:RNA polymerase sigma-70 factor (ECF subfamily)
MKNDIVTLKRAVDMLPPKCMMVFKLVREDGLNHDEAARLLNISPREVEKQMDIAVRKLAQALRNSWFIENVSL